MSKFVKNLALFIAGLPLLSSKAFAMPSTAPSVLSPDDLKAVPLRPLNREFDNLFAAHSSHSSHRSHASHASHYSGSGGAAATYAAPAPAPDTTYRAPAASNAAPAYVNAQPATETAPSLTRAEKLRTQIMRVQIKLHTLGLYDDKIDGVLNLKTREALKLFQKVKSLPESGTMTTPTLNALGVPVVH